MPASKKPEPKKEQPAEDARFSKPGQVPPSRWTVGRAFDSADFVADPLPVEPPPGYAEKPEADAAPKPDEGKAK